MIRWRAESQGGVRARVESGVRVARGRVEVVPRTQAEVVRDVVVTPAAGVARDVSVTPAAGVARDVSVTPAAGVARDVSVTPAPGVVRDGSVTPAAGVVRNVRVTPAPSVPHGVSVTPAPGVVFEIPVTTTTTVRHDVRTSVLARASLACSALLALFTLAATDPVQAETKWGRFPEEPEPEFHLLSPAFHNGHPELGELSGLARTGDWIWANNDSGDKPRIFRARALDFSDAVIFPIADADAIDWEEITIFEGDLLICDVGDNRRNRDDLMLYRVAPTSRVDGVALTPRARYPIRYPDGKHDAEAAFAIGSSLFIVNKDRGEGTSLYRFDRLSDEAALAPGESNVGTLVAGLFVGEHEMVTAAAVDDAADTLYLLTYGSIRGFALRNLVPDLAPRAAVGISERGSRAGDSRIRPDRTILTWMRQAEAMCFRDGTLIIANEDRDVFVLEKKELEAIGMAIPARPNLDLPKIPLQRRLSTPLPTGPLAEQLSRLAGRIRRDTPMRAWAGRGGVVDDDSLMDGVSDWFGRSSGQVRGTLGAGWSAVKSDVPLRAAGGSEMLRWFVNSSHLYLEGRFQLTGARPPTHIPEVRPPHGSGGNTKAESTPALLQKGIVLGFAREPLDRATGDEVLIGIRPDSLQDVVIERLTADGDEFTGVVLPGATGRARTGIDYIEIYAMLPLESLRWTTTDDERPLLFDLHGYNLREGAEVHVSAPGIFALERPYTWAIVRVTD